MSVPKRKIVYNNTEYEVCEWAIEEVEHNGLAFTDEYIAYLLENDIPYLPCSLDLLAHYDILNRKYTGSKGLLGRVVKLDKKGNILGYFETVLDAGMDAVNGGRYSFERLHEEGVESSKVTYDFFGMKINTHPDNMADEIVRTLNRIIRRIRNICLGKNRTFREMYTGRIADQMTYEEYVLRGMRREAFLFGFEIHMFANVPAESRYTKHDVEKCGDYIERLDLLLRKYSVDGATVFEQVQDLNKVKGFAGIYLLCLPQIKGCYVGKTEKCFATRIKQHFTTPNSAFDRKYKPTDIKEIYVLQLDETMQLIDSVEEDCIATLGNEVCLNAFAGGKSVELIKSEKYDEKQHLLSPNILRWIAEDSLNIAKYRKACVEEDV
ncbi:MAG: GIY-YIG nuclease family protein [Clostridia bacterium]|nr:GIY-YIG nuclease family protein [Clostridia bacterium]